MNVVSQDDQWLEKYNQLKEFHQTNGHTKVTFSNCAEKSLVHWVKWQRYWCKMESRIKLLNAVEFIWSSPEDLQIDIVSHEDQWLENYNQLKEFYQKHGHTQVTYSNFADKSLVGWVRNQRQRCKTESRIKLLNAIGFVWSSPEDLWLEKFNQLKEFYQKHGHTKVGQANCAEKSFVDWVGAQRQCKIISRIKLLKSIGFGFSEPKIKEDRRPLPVRKKCSMEESNQRFKMCLNAATAKKSIKATDDNQRCRGNAAVYAGCKSSTVGEILDKNKSTGNNLEARESERRKTLDNSSISGDIGTQNELNRNLEQQKSKFTPKASDCRRPTLTNLAAYETIAALRKQELNEAFDDSELTDANPKSKAHAQQIASNKRMQHRLSQEFNEAKELQERLLRQSANRVRYVSRNKRKFESVGQTHALSKPAEVNDLPKDHWKSSDLYYRLGLPKNASEIEIKKQFRKLALAYHPDKSSFVNGMMRFQAIKEAYELLYKP